MKNSDNLIEERAPSPSSQSPRWLLPMIVGVACGVLLTAALPLQKDSRDPAQLVQAELAESAEQIARVRKDTEHQMAAMTVRMAELQARLLRLDALGERLVSVGKLEPGEFDFAQIPAVGGPNEADPALEMPRLSFLDELEQLADDIDAREQQLNLLEQLMVNRKLQKDVSLVGRPIERGWLSSRFGRRTDPFTGRSAWHSGVDFAAPRGSSIVSVGSGVVTWAGKRYGYGNLIEVNHGSGYTTRYAHALSVEVKVGDIVRRGQKLGTIGSTGRSTGPHVHFEVRLDGKAVDPTQYVLKADP